MGHYHVALLPHWCLFCILEQIVRPSNTMTSGGRTSAEAEGSRLPYREITNGLHPFLRRNPSSVLELILGRRGFPDPDFDRLCVSRLVQAVCSVQSRQRGKPSMNPTLHCVLPGLCARTCVLPSVASLGRSVATFLASLRQKMGFQAASEVQICRYHRGGIGLRRDPE